MNSGHPICRQPYRGRDSRAGAAVVEANFAFAIMDASRPIDSSAAASNELDACIVGRAFEATEWLRVSTSGEAGEQDGVDADGTIEAMEAAA